MSSPLHKTFSTDTSPALHAAPDKGAGAAVRATPSQTAKGAQTNGQSTDEASSETKDDGGRSQRPGPTGEGKDAGEGRPSAQEKVVLPTHERFEPSWPKVTPAPVPQVSVSPELPKVCGLCPAWHRSNRHPFGQCLAAMRALGAPMYTPDLGSCTLPESERAKMGRL